ncbi:MAG: SDR family NAD(P)-dependent oxidoreductase [Nanoarchaeota archaeon]|nr:SDR family NAD(P)-dependent oxidoreductase [Nanoarchaeota archaeon]
MEKCLVTGGAGFIGSHLVDMLLKNNFKVIVIDDLSSGNIENIKHNLNNPDFKFLELDITDKEKVKETFISERPDYVFHLAAQINLRESIKDPINDARINILGLLNLLENSRENKVKKFIFSSSAAVYSDEAKIPISENDKTGPLSPYGITKLTTEKYLEFYKREYLLDFVILRYSNVYGPRQNTKGEAGVVSVFINNILNNKPIFINGSGEQTRDYIFVEDVAFANLITIKDLSGIYNVSTKIETSVNELHQKIRDIANKPIEKINAPEINAELKRSCLDNQKICFKGWYYKTDLNRGLLKTYNWFKENI